MKLITTYSMIACEHTCISSFYNTICESECVLRLMACMLVDIMLILSDNVLRSLVILANTLWPIKLIGILILANNPLGEGGSSL